MSAFCVSGIGLKCPYKGLEVLGICRRAPVESPVGVLATTDRPYSVAVPHHRLADVDERPTWRGRTHLWAFGLALPATVVLVAGAHPGRPRLAALIYAVTLVAMFGFSAAHHRLGLTHRAGAVLQRLDHSAIYALIAGTYAPVCLVALPPRWGIPLLAIVAGAAGVGMGIKLVAFGRLNVTSYVMYPALGWVSVLAMPILVRHLSAGQLALILAGGLAYTLGMVVLWRRWPDPRPRRFGYHEVWHLFTIVAAALHFAAVASVVR